MITTHQATVSSDVNRKLTIEGSDPVSGGNSNYKVAHADGPGHIDVQFQTADRPGLTNEALLAIVADRLQGFQSGPCACEENAAALSHIRIALTALHERTWRRATQSTGDKAVDEKKAEEKARVRMEGDDLHIGSTVFAPSALMAWSVWGSHLLGAVQRLDPPVTSGETEVIEKAAAHLGGGARNGLAEFKSAMATTSRAKKAG